MITEKLNHRARNHKFHFVSLFAAIISFLLDLASKNWALSTLKIGESQPFFAPLLRFSLVSNKGAAFSLGNDHSLLVLVTATCILIALIVWFLWRIKRGFGSPLEELGLSIIIGAAAGNLLNRYQYGFVVDFLEFTFIRFPVFNVADALIDVGVGLVFISIFAKSMGGSRQGSARTEKQ